MGDSPPRRTPQFLFQGPRPVTQRTGPPLSSLPTIGEQIDRLGIRDHLILYNDFIPDSEVKYYLCAADVLVQPYRNATQSGVTPVAYHFEVPMIVTNVGGLPAMVPDDKVGLVAEPTAESLGEKITEYLAATT